MSAYYSENDPFAAAWLRELIKDRLIAPGEVDERSIHDVAGADLRGFTQVHLFAGIGGWSYALRLAGWRDDEPVWTGSCPCQPFSAAGKQRGTADDRHLWPEMCRLLAECRPPVVFGEQVASKDGRLWLAGVRADLEALGYAVGGADLCAAGVGAPHIRQRLYWVADAQRDTGDARRLADQPGEGAGASSTGPCVELRRRGVPSGLAHTVRDGARPRPAASDRSESSSLTVDGSSPRRSAASGERSALSRLAHANGRYEGDRDLQRGGQHGQQPQDGGVGERVGDASSERLPKRPRAEDRCGAVRDEGASAAAASAWDGEFIDCADGKARRVEPSIFPLAYGISGRVATRRTRIEASREIQEEKWHSRVGTLRGAGNAIVPQVAAEFIRAYRSPVTAP